MRTFHVPTKPYNFRLYSRSNVTFYPGLTTLVGCNGSGKSTLMSLIREQLQSDDNTLVFKYDDRIDGGYHLMEKLGFNGDMIGLAGMYISSEGERIISGIADFVPKIRPTIRKNNPKEVWILLDAVGSGLSIDGIHDIKDLFETIKQDNPDRDVYFVVSTNEFEFAVDSDCVDVTTFLHVHFLEYDTYRAFILNTRAKKDRRIARQIVNQKSKS